MMLGSVFNQHQVSTNSEPSRAPQAKLRILKIGQDTYPFSEFRGLGPPELNIGLPGDTYIDLTPGLHALYARYPENWSLWPGPKDVSTLLLHPNHSDRCLWCNDTIGWFHPRNVRVNPSGTASELLSEALKHQATLLEESKKRKRDALGQVHQPMRTKPSSSSSMTNTLSLSQNCTSMENQNPTDTLSSSDSRYYTGPPTIGSHESSIPTEKDHKFTSTDLKECSEISQQERYTSPKQVDLRKITFGDAKPRPFARRGAASLTYGVVARSDTLLTNKEQSLPQLRLRSPLLPDVISQSSIQEPETSRIFRNIDASLDQSTKANSMATSGETFVDNADLQILPTKSFSFSLSELPACDERGLAKESPLTKATQGDNGLTLNIAIAELRKMKEASDANATYVRAVNDKIHHLEAENAKLRARLLNQCQCHPSSCDIRPMVPNVQMSPAADSDAWNGAALNALGRNSKQPQNVGGLGQSQRESSGPLEIVRNIPSDSQLYPKYQPCKEELESRSARRHSATSSTSLLLSGTTLLTETASSVHAVPLLESATVEYQNIINTFKVEAETPPLDKCKSLESSLNTSPSVKEEIVDSNLWHGALTPFSPVPMSTLPQLRKIHRSVLFAKAGSLLICRICLGTKLGGIETVDQAFTTVEDSPELMQEHCVKEHLDECEALVNMRDEELLDLVLMITSEY